MVAIALSATFCSESTALANDAAPEANEVEGPAEDEKPAGGDDGDDGGDGGDDGDVIYIFSERPDKPFDRDTEERLTEEAVQQRAVVNLADAVDLLPDVTVRAAGRGGRQIDVRGGRKAALKILVDGVPISDPYYGNIDIASIPVTDIVQVRVSKSPGSPIDGIGGPGGVIEIHTRDAVGGRMLVAQAQGTSLPSFLAAATGRAPLTDHVAVRASATGTAGFQNFSIVPAMGPSTDLREDRQQVAGGARAEYRRGKRRLFLDLYGQHQSLITPPREDGGGDVLQIRSENRQRVVLSAEDELSGWRLLGRSYFSALQRDSAAFDDPALTTLNREEDLKARLGGLFLLANRPIGKTTQVVGSAAVDVEHARVDGFDGRLVTGRSSVIQFASGAQYEDGPFKLDGALGLAIPVGIGADPWPELKLSATYWPISAVSFKVIGGRKGRVPTLRERFDLGNGNEALAPEQVWFIEGEVRARPTDLVSLTVATYNRRSTGIIQFDRAAGMLQNANTISIRGSELRLDVGDEFTPLSGGASWVFIDAYDEERGTDPLDFLPRHRVDAWVNARLGERFGGTLRARWFDEQIDQATTLPNRTAVDVAGYARFLERYFVSARLESHVLGGGDFELADDYFIRAGVLTPGLVFSLTVRGEWE